MTTLRTLAEALNYALNQWAMYADNERGPGLDFTYIGESTDAGDVEAAEFARCRAALRGQQADEPVDMDVVAKVSHALHALHTTLQPRDLAVWRVPCGWGFHEPGEPSDCRHFAVAIVRAAALRGQVREGIDEPPMMAVLRRFWSIPTMAGSDGHEWVRRDSVSAAIQDLPDPALSGGEGE